MFLKLELPFALYKSFWSKAYRYHQPMTSYKEKESILFEHSYSLTSLLANYYKSHQTLF